MIHVEHLTKTYSGRTAVDAISFEVERGEIVAFLGPNGAGKTTTMRMLTGFVPPTRGSVRVAGFDVFDHPVEARRHIGYMPESCPLYMDMRVDEYLTFRARIKGVSPRRLKARRDEVKEQCGLTDAGRRIIGQLSKGYRQRVGLADSLIHEPDLLILDEPTAGLDPVQIREVRELIRNLAQRHTLLLSTHILPEAEMTCSRILIIHDGQIVASDTPESLQRRLEGDLLVTAEIAGEADVVRAALCEVDSVDTVTVEAMESGWGRYRISAGSPDIRTRIFERASQAGWPVRELHLESRSLEELFVVLTGKEGGV